MCVCMKFHIIHAYDDRLVPRMRRQHPPLLCMAIIYGI